LILISEPLSGNGGIPPLLFIYNSYNIIVTMKSILFVGITAALAIAATSFGFSLTSAQMADNATMGNMTAGNMTIGTGNMTGDNATETGSISGVGEEIG
jgi:hypothetical protein